MKKRLLAGITKENELYFLNIEIKKDGSSNENLFKQIMKIWKRYHLKIITGSALSIIEETKKIEQDFEKLAVEAIKIINA